MARHTNEQVAHLFAHHQAGDSNNLHSDGATLKSYSTVIAFWSGEDLFISSDGMSTTTNGKHLSPLRSAARHLRPFYSPAFSWGRYGAPTPEKCIIEAAKEMEEMFKTLCRSRVNMGIRIEWYEARRAEILEYADRYNIQDLPDMPEATRDLKEKAKELAKKDRERRAEETRKREERERAQRIIDQGELDLWLTQGRGRYPYSFRKRGEDQITIKNGYIQHDPSAGWRRNTGADTVVTSQGAEAPLDHVVKALRFYDSQETKPTYPGTTLGARFFKHYHTNGHKIHLGAFVLDSIDEQGNVKAGCHTFTAVEIARFRKQWEDLLK